MPPSPASSRKSERLEKQTLTTPPVKRKLMTVEKHVPNALRRSERGNKQSSLGSSGSKKSEKSSASSDAKKPKEKREKSVKQLILETKEIEKQDTKLVQTKKKKTSNARAYLAFLVQDGSNQVNASDQGKELNRLDTPDNDMSRGRNSKQVHSKHDYDKNRSKLMKEYVQRPLDVVSEDSFSSLNKTGVGISTPSPKLIHGGKALEVEDGDGLQKSKSDDSAHADCTSYKKTGSPELPESTIFGMRGDANISLVATHKVASLKRKRDLDMDTDTDTDTEGKRTETSRTYLKRQSMSRTSHIECEGGRTVRDAQKSLYLRLKPEISKLCETLQLSEEIRGMVEKFFKYVMNNHSISKEPLQAFQISLCWIAASMLRKKINQKQSIVLAQQHLNFSCNEEEASHVYLKLRCLKHLFLYHSCYDKIANSSRVSASSSKDTFGSPNAYKHQQEDIMDRSLSIKELVERDISIAIKRLKKTCDMQLSNLISMQHKEVNEVYRSYEEEKVELENKHRTELAVILCLDRSSAGADRLKILENAFASKIEQQKKQFNTNIADLMERQSSARKKVEQKFVHLEDDVKSWLQVELLNRLPSDKSGCVLENPQISEAQYPGNAPLVQSGCTFPQRDPLHPSQAFQDQCSLPSLSIEMLDGDQPGSKEGNDAGQSEASPSLPNDDTLQSDYNFEASAIEPVVQSQLSPDISPNENPLDLSSAGEIGHTPSTREQNGSDIDAQYVGCHEASVMETLHGHVLQDQCSMLSISTEMQDGDAPGTKERHATEQVEVPQSNPNDDAVPYADEPSSKKGNETGQGEAPQSHLTDDTVQPDYNFEAPVIEPVLQSQLSPTDISPNLNPLDLSSAGEIGHTPSTQEQNGNDIDVQYVDNHKASVTETLHGHVLQDQCSMPSISTEIQDGDAPGIKEQYATEQVESPKSNPNDDAVPYADEPSSKEGNEIGEGEAPPSHPNDDTVQSDCNFEAPIIEPVLQSQLSPTDISAGEIGHTPSTRDLNGSDIDAQYVGCHEASVMETLHGHVLQDQCSMLSISTEMQDGDAPGTKERHATEQVEVPQSNPNDDAVPYADEPSSKKGNETGQGEAPQSHLTDDTVQPDYNFEAPVIEPVLQSQLSPTDISPNLNPLDLSSGGKIGHTPSTQEQNGNDIDVQYVDNHEASATETLHGHVLQDQCSMLSISTEIQDGDAPGIKEQYATEQVESPKSNPNDDAVPYADEPSSKEGNETGEGEAPPSHPNDDTVQSDCNFEAPIIEPVLQSQLSPTDISPSLNPPDLSSAGEIGHTPSTREQNGSDIDAQYVGCHEASVMETLHGHVPQDQCSMLSISTEMQDGDAPGTKERHATEQVEVPQSNPNDNAVPYADEPSSKKGNETGQGEAPQSHLTDDTVQPDYNFEAPVIEPVLQSQLSPTDISPNLNPLDLSSAGEIGHIPSTQEQNGNDIDVQYVDNHEASVTETLHGHVLQDQCSMLSISTERQDGDARGIKEQYATEQVESPKSNPNDDAVPYADEPSSKEGNETGEGEAPPSHPNDDTVQSDCNFEAPIIEPVLQSQLSPTDISPSLNPPDLSSAGEIGHTPSTQEQNGNDIDVQYVDNHEASVMGTLQGHVLQDQCSMPSVSAEMQDRDAPGIKERHATEQVEAPQFHRNDDSVPYGDEPCSKEGNETGQVEAPQSHPNDDTVQSDYNFEAPTIIEPVVQDEGEPSSKEGNISGQGEAPQSLPKDDTVQSDYNLEASIIEPVVQSQLSPTDTSPNDNPLDLSSAGEIGHLPITQEQSGTHNDVQSGGNCEASVREPVVHVSPMDFSSGHNQPDLPSSGEIEYQTRTENDLPSGVEIEYQHSNEVQNVTAEVEPPPRSQSIDALPSEHRIHETVVREPVLQFQLPASLDSTPGHNPLLASRPLGDDPQRRQMQPTHAGSRMPLPLSLDPLQNELDMIHKDMDRSIKICEDKKLQLKADCEKEIEEVIVQIHKKYEIKLQESEVEFSHKKKEMDASHNKLLMNKILAEAFRCKCMDDRASGIQGIQQDIMTSFRQQPGQRSPSVTSLSVTSAQHPTVTSPQSSTLPAPGLHATSSSQQPVYYSRPLVSTPTISSRTSPISHSAMSLQGGSGIRAPSPSLLTSPISHPALSRQGGSVIRSPAPHLKRFKPPASLPLSNTLPLPFDLPSQQPPNTVIPPSIPLSSSSILAHSHRMPSQPTPNTVNSSTPLPPSSLHPLPCRTPSQLTPNTTSYPSTPLSSTNALPFSYSMPAPDTASSPISLSSTSLPPLPSRMPGQRTPNNHPLGLSSSALEFMDIDRRYGATLPDILSPLPDLGSSGLGLHGSYVGARAPRASSSGDIVCLSDDD